MARKLTKKQSGFINSYIETGNGGLAAKQNYNTTDNNTAYNIASTNLRKPKIAQEIENRVKRAKQIIFEIAQYGESDSVRLLASKDIVDRGEGKAVERSININVPATVELSEVIARKNMAQPQQTD